MRHLGGLLRLSVPDGSVPVTPSAPVPRPYIVYCVDAANWHVATALWAYTADDAITAVKLRVQGSQPRDAKHYLSVRVLTVGPPHTDKEREWVRYAAEGPGHYTVYIEWHAAAALHEGLAPLPRAASGRP